jgi:hypothetical protein
MRRLVQAGLDADLFLDAPDGADSVRSAMTSHAVRDSRRTFSRGKSDASGSDKAGCASCAGAIPFDLMHGDHIHSWIAGGPTVFENCQIAANPLAGQAVGRRLRVRART